MRPRIDSHFMGSPCGRREDSTTELQNIQNCLRREGFLILRLPLSGWTDSPFVETVTELCR
jgi:hypothetical protein